MDEDKNEGYLPAVKSLFLKAGDRLRGRTEAEKVRRGLKLLKRKLIGFCGCEKKKSIDDIASALMEIGVVSSADEGREAVPLLEKSALFYEQYKCLVIKNLNDGVYRIGDYIGERAHTKIFTEEISQDYYKYLRR